MSRSRRSPWSDAVRRLFELPEPGWGDAPDRWDDYRAMGLTAADVPELVRLATDEALHNAGEDAPVHAWRALAQLGDVAAIGPLARLVIAGDAYETDWIHQELPEVMGVFGAPAIPVLLELINEARHPEDAYLAWIEGLTFIADAHPAERDGVADALTEQMAQHAHNDPVLNAFFVFALVHLKAMVAVPIIQAAFAAGHVDESVSGTWDDAQVLMGLKPPDAAFHARERARMAALMQGEDDANPYDDDFDEGFDDGFDGEPPPNPMAPVSAAQKAKKKAKAKQAKASRKKNRKK